MLDETTSLIEHIMCPSQDEGNYTYLFCAKIHGDTTIADKGKESFVTLTAVWQ